MGADYVRNGEYPSVALLYCVLVIGSVMTAGQRIGYQVLFGRRKLRILATLFCLEGAANVSLCLLLIRPFGLLGVAIGIALPAIVFQGLRSPSSYVEGWESRWQPIFAKWLLGRHLPRSHSRSCCIRFLPHGIVRHGRHSLSPGRRQLLCVQFR